jgi:hypothetical protein
MEAIHAGWPEELCGHVCSGHTLLANSIMHAMQIILFYFLGRDLGSLRDYFCEGGSPATLNTLSSDLTNVLQVKRLTDRRQTEGNNCADHHIVTSQSH